MSEMMKSSENMEPNESPYSVLQNEPSFEEHIKNLEVAREDDKENVILSGEATRMIKNEDGKPRLESSYLDVYYDYTNSDAYDPHNPKDRELGKAIWDVSMSSALLDLDDDFAKMASGDTEFNLNALDPGSQRQYKKAFNSLLDIFKNSDENQIEWMMEQMEDIGRVGETMSDVLDTLNYFKETGQELPPPYDLSVPANSQLSNTGELNSEASPDEHDKQFNRLEQEYSDVMRFNKGDLEAINNLYARYGELSKTITDPKIMETIEKRRNNLFSLNNRLEEINKKSYFDD